MRNYDISRVLSFARSFALVAFFSLSVFSAPVIAAEVEHKGEGAHKSEGGHNMRPDGEHEDKLAFTGYKRWDLGVYTIVVFVLLILILSKFAWPHITEGLAKREATIRTAQEEAKQDRITAEKQLAEAKRKLDDAAAQAKAIVDEARKAADALKASEKEASLKEIEARKQQVERELAAYKDSLEKDVYSQAVQLAALMSEKALRREVSTADHSRFLEESIAELKSAASKA